MIEDKFSSTVVLLRLELETADEARLSFLKERYDIREAGREEVMMLDFSGDNGFIKIRNFRRAGSWFLVGRDKIEKIMMLGEI